MQNELTCAGNKGSVTTKAPCSASPAAWIKGDGGIEGTPKAGGTSTAMTSEVVGHDKSTCDISGSKRGGTGSGGN
jgi:hypothetical protein